MTRVNEMLKVFERAQDTLDDAQLQDFFPSAKPTQTSPEKSSIALMIDGLTALVSKATQAATALVELSKVMSELSAHEGRQTTMADELRDAAIRALTQSTPNDEAQATHEGHEAHEDCEHVEGDYIPMPEPTFDADRLCRLLFQRAKKNNQWLDWAALHEYLLKAHLVPDILDKSYHHIASVQLGMPASTKHPDPVVMASWLLHPSVQAKVKSAGFAISVGCDSQGGIKSIHVVKREEISTRARVRPTPEKV